MAQGIYKITETFEQMLCDYTGSPYAVAVDNQSNALWSDGNLLVDSLFRF